MTEPSSTRESTPTRVGGRYLLRGELGRGGMATVHRALDEVLHREVAVKLLHAHLATDPAFLDRFRREARAAAALAHPNVVAVHDWGETDDGAYLVLQLVEGPSLRELLRRRGRLTPAEALAVLGPAAAGLGAAHAAGLVHRDVKPENLLLGHDGVVRVTDFGLARAAASATSTFGADVLVGSPHYLSPEAVRGLPLDPRADVYALGVVLFECLTGRPPHEGDSPFATAVQHTSQRVPAPSTLVADIDPDLDDLVVAATSHDPRERPEDGAVFARELELVVPGGPAALELTTDTIVVPHARPDTGTRSIPADDVATVVGANGAPPATAWPPDGWDDDAGAHVDTWRGDAAGAEEPPHGTAPDDEPAGGRRSRRRRGWYGFLLVLVLLAASAAGGYLLWDRVLAPVTDIPSVLGDAHGEAIAQLESAGFTVRTAGDRPFDLEVPADHVLSQEPTGTARRGTVVELTVSAGPRQVEVPDVVGDDAEEAVAALRDAGLAPVVTEQHHEEVAAGLVVATDPGAQAVLDETSEIQVTVSLGPAPIEVPEVVGMTRSEAESHLRDADLTLEVTGRPHHESVPEGAIIGQTPAPGETLRRGQAVEVTVSAGPETILVPNVRGMQAEEARETLAELGFEVEVEERGGLRALLTPGRVFDQDPGPDAPRHRGDLVTLFAYER